MKKCTGVVSATTFVLHWTARDRLVKFLTDETSVVFMECFRTPVLAVNTSDPGIETETILVILTYYDGRKATYTIKN